MRRHAGRAGRARGGADPRTSGSTVSPPVLGDRYRRERLLGEGARKRVHLAVDTLLGREVALSVFKTEGLDGDALERARREAEAMARLGDHPNIVTVHDIGGGEPDGELFLVSQLMLGGDLGRAPGRGADTAGSTSPRSCGVGTRDRSRARARPPARHRAP